MSYMRFAFGTVGRTPGGPKGQLYNMEQDPKEAHNLWLERTDLVEELTALVDRIRLQGRSAPFDNI